MRALGQEQVVDLRPPVVAEMEGQRQDAGRGSFVGLPQVRLLHVGEVRDGLAVAAEEPDVPALVDEIAVRHGRIVLEDVEAAVEDELA